MANECLVTKLKGIVQNDNLPVLNQLQFKIGGKAVSGISGIYVAPSDGSSINVASTVPLHRDSPSGQEVTQETITRRTLYYYNENDPQGIVRIYGDDFYKLAMFAASVAFEPNSGVDSLKYCSLRGIGIGDRKDIMFGIEGIREVYVEGADVDATEIP